MTRQRRTFFITLAIFAAWVVGLSLMAYKADKPRPASVNSAPPK
jgi:hypothetical protein